MKMVFASDLDRTLIFSKKFFAEQGETPTDIFPIDKVGDKEISYISNTGYANLQRINRAIEFIPVTSRTTEEYHRVFNAHTMQPKYAIVSSGGKILKNGIEDEEWNSIVNNNISEVKNTIQTISEKLTQHIPTEMIRDVRFSEDLFWRILLHDNSMVSQLLNDHSDSFKDAGYELSATGSRIYIVPRFVTKWGALEFLLNKIKATKVIAAGDSLMDLEMIQMADIGITSPHGEIYEVGNDKDLKDLFITKNIGVPAGEEILSKVLEVIFEMKGE